MITETVVGNLVPLNHLLCHHMLQGSQTLDKKQVQRCTATFIIRYRYSVLVYSLQNNSRELGTGAVGNTT